VIVFLVPVSPLTVFIVAMVTSYNNALVFSIYSYFLPRDQQGKFLMPKPITDSGTQILIAGSILGLVMGLVMLTFSLNGHPKNTFVAIDLKVFAVLLLCIFVIYIYKLLRDLEDEEDEVHTALKFTEDEIDIRQDLVFKHLEKAAYQLSFFFWCSEY
jgi:Ca2+/Na+ antiporter